MRRLIFASSVVALLAGCGGDPVLDKQDGKGLVKLEAACSLAGLPSALRETLVVIDKTMVKPADPETFRVENPELWALVTGLADGQRASDTGAMAPRERLTIALADPQSGGLEQLFTGCLPGLSADEMAGRTGKGEDGLSSKFFGSDMASQISRQREEFLKQVVISIATAKFGGQARPADNFGDSGFARTLKTVGPGRGTPGLVRRVFLFADPAKALTTVPAEYVAARKQGFDASDGFQANFGQSDIYVVPAGRPLGENQRAFLDAFLLASRGDLKSVAPFSPDGLSKPPVRLISYSGELPLGGGIKTPMELRLASAADGTIVNSWISYTGSKGVRATPLAGQFVCGAEGVCDLRGDPNLSLGQRWRTEPGKAPQPLPEGPFGGMRLIEGKDDGQRLTGRIYDPVIYVGDTGDIPLVARRTE
ncbi:hypothetical protein HJG53_02600 [Sphingomonas sp. ID1715]|uniref:hypothetical protein n=1 Tax=Sphingomonas sp. ID1715 TaxID=1656898 RepID=UPI001489965D|nr:hypothetical protein [Sphingomonas sp. ID1715]NNM75796.1 hypothetical protein [Sphingomonas sp. ID1715]